ncbi:hypothetical protein V8C86DRAFT_223593 [Haematococcus lacustris]
MRPHSTSAHNLPYVCGRRTPYMADSGSDDLPLGARGKEGLKRKGAATNGKASVASNGKANAAVKAESKVSKPSTAVKEEEVPAPKKTKTDDSGKEKVAKVKKEFDMPGQTRDTPPETDSLRKFYTSLLEQKSDSAMAKKWCLQHGLLELDEAEALLKELGKKPLSSVKSPVKAPPRKPSAQAQAKAQPVKRKTAAAPTSKAGSKSDAKPSGKAAGSKAAIAEKPSGKDASGGNAKATSATIKADSSSAAAAATAQKGAAVKAETQVKMKKEDNGP